MKTVLLYDPIGKQLAYKSKFVPPIGSRFRYQRWDHVDNAPVKICAIVDSVEVDYDSGLYEEEKPILTIRVYLKEKDVAATENP